jgi:hypothetical protein
MKFNLPCRRLSRTVGFLIASLLGGVGDVPAASDGSVTDRIAGRGFPSVFQAWNPIDLTNQFPLKTLEDRLQAAAKHDLLWEEPVSQLGYNVELVLGAVWNHRHGGIAADFTAESKRQALANRQRMLQLNPNMVFLLEVRWRDAPGSFLPADSPFWKRNPDGTRKQGWDGGPEPYYLMNPDNPDFAANIARQCKIAIDSGVYDGVMFDWDGYLPIVKKTREIIGDRGLIICNIHDRINLGEQYKGMINGAFMELSQEGPGSPPRKLGTWESSRQALLYFEANFAKPQVNCLESWGDRKDLRRMRAVTALALTHSDGYVLYADPNPLMTPDHLHDWYPFWDAKLGKPDGKCLARQDGAYQREFERGTVIYNPLDNRKPVRVKFASSRTRVADGTKGTEFSVESYDGEIFLK